MNLGNVSIQFFIHGYMYLDDKNCTEASPSYMENGCPSF